MAVRVVLLIALLAAPVALADYAPTWASLDSRPLPAWYDEAKVGIFIHWGVFSVPSFGSEAGGASGEWFWYQLNGSNPNPAYQSFFDSTVPQGFTYPDYAPQFNAYWYNATEWVEIFEGAGANYVVLTSKHHEGFTLWPSATSFNWNSMDVGPHRDLVGELADAVQASGKMHFGLYHSLFEWFNPVYLADKASGFKTRNFVDGKTMPELYDIVNRYKPNLIWSDGDWEAPDSYWNATNFLAWLANESPVKDVAVWNDRWGQGDTCTHGSYYTCTDRYLPNVAPKHKWENAFTLDLYSWGYRRNMKLQDVMDMDTLIATIVKTVSLGGNALVNVGATSDGRIPLVLQDRLAGMGNWLGINGEAIYATHPWRYQNDSAVDVWYTSAGTNVYAIATSWPSSGTLHLTVPIPSASTSVTLLGATGNLSWQPATAVGKAGLIVTLPPSQPCSHGWSFKLVNVA
jgi:alpha-L-fucosidase